MQPPMAIDRTSNWYVWDLVWGMGAGQGTQETSKVMVIFLLSWEVATQVFIPLYVMEVLLYLFKI